MNSDEVACYLCIKSNPPLDFVSTLQILKFMEKALHNLSISCLTPFFLFYVCFVADCQF